MVRTDLSSIESLRSSVQILLYWFLESVLDRSAADGVQRLSHGTRFLNTLITRRPDISTTSEFQFVFKLSHCRQAAYVTGSAGLRSKNKGLRPKKGVTQGVTPFLLRRFLQRVAKSPVLEYSEPASCGSKLGALGQIYWRPVRTLSLPEDKRRSLTSFNYPTSHTDVILTSYKSCHISFVHHYDWWFGLERFAR
jgi:hypothetical protein